MSGDIEPQLYRRPGVWVPSIRGNIPRHAVAGGEDFTCVTYICRVNHCGNILIGKLVPSHNRCYIPFKGSEYAYEEYQVLCNPDHLDLSWRWTSDGVIATGALQGGCSADGERLYIGRHWHEGTVAIGTVVPSKKCVYVTFSGLVYAYNEYEILVCDTIIF